MGRGGRVAWAGFALAVAVHLAVLYWPRTVTTPSGFPVDKPVHALIFLAVLVAGTWAGIALAPLAGVLLAHAVVSELVQHTLLPNRSGDPFDALADAAGVLLGVVLVTGRRRSRQVQDPADATGRVRR